MPTTRIVVFVIAAALVAGCSGSDATPPSMTTSTLVVPTTASSTTTTVATTTTTSPGDLVAALLETFAATPLRATYLVGAGSRRAEVTISQDPEADPPMAAVIVPDSHSKLIRIGERAIFCDTMASTCFEMPENASEPGTTESRLLGPVAAVLFASEPPASASFSGPISEETFETVGRRGLCFEFVPPPEVGLDAERAILCIDSEAGFALQLDTVDDIDDVRETIIILTEVTDPRPDDFEPVGPVVPAP